MKVFIYGLVNPVTNEIVYVGQTSKELTIYLKSKYWKLNEVKRGERNWTKLFHYLDDLLPKKVNIKIIRECDTNKPFDNPNFLEKYYIDKYRKINPNLLNETDGGIGGNTYKNKSKNEIKGIGIKISSKIKGKKKPEGFAEHLSAIRKGKNNPMAKKFKRKIGCYKNSELIKTFEYAYEVNDFIGVKNAYSNVHKVLIGKLFYKPYGYSWRYLNE